MTVGKTCSDKSISTGFFQNRRHLDHLGHFHRGPHCSLWPTAAPSAPIAQSLGKELLLHVPRCSCRKHSSGHWLFKRSYRTNNSFFFFAPLIFHRVPDSVHQLWPEAKTRTLWSSPHWNLLRLRVGPFGSGLGSKSASSARQRSVNATTAAE